MMLKGMFFVWVCLREYAPVRSYLLDSCNVQIYYVLYIIKHCCTKHLPMPMETWVLVWIAFIIRLNCKLVVMENLMYRLDKQTGSNDKHDDDKDLIGCD